MLHLRLSEMSAGGGSQPPSTLAHPALCHSEGPWIHAQEQDALVAMAVGADVVAVCVPRVLQRVVRVLHWLRKRQLPQPDVQLQLHLQEV